MKNRIPTDTDIEEAAFNNLEKQLPKHSDKALIELLTTVQADGAKWMRDELVKLGLLDVSKCNCYKGITMSEFGEPVRCDNCNE